MLVERNMIHDIVDLIPDSDMPKIYAILNAYLSADTEESLSDEEETLVADGFRQIDDGDCMTLADYRKLRGLTK